ncbi:hypothetical protein F5X97DRAFT_321115 [Nemania serpens]|nr:hypothetical protein F5X97DRAFT_321115 [Nemania serpens]
MASPARGDSHSLAGIEQLRCRRRRDWHRQHGGLSVLFALYKSRSLYIADWKLELIRAELGKRNVELHVFGKPKDLPGPIAIGSVGVITRGEIGDLIDGTTNIEKMGAGLSAGVSPSTGLLDNPAEAAHGARGAVE